MAEIVKANQEVVTELMNHLLASFKDFVGQKCTDTPEGVSFVDSLMGIHNFYKSVILDLEVQAGDHNNAIRKLAVDTLRKGLGVH